MAFARFLVVTSVVLRVITTGGNALAAVHGQALDFSPPKQYPVAYAPFSIAAGDFDGDGRADLVAGCIYGVWVLLSTGDGAFHPLEAATTVPLGNPELAVGDFNGDGKLDLAASAPELRMVRVYLGEGGGRFAPAKVLRLPEAPATLLGADFDGDGLTDLGVGLAGGTNDFVILRGTAVGDPILANPAHFGFELRCIVAADFAGQGKLGLAALDIVREQVCLFAGKGDGAFAPAGVVPTLDFPVSLVTGDFNGDGKPDLAMANRDGDSVTVLLNRGADRLEASGDFAAGNLPESLTAADLNGDKHLDLIVAHRHGGKLALLAGCGDGTFQAPQELYAGSGACRSAIGDFDGDGRPDIATANYLAGTVSVLLNNGSKSNTQAQGQPEKTQSDSKLPEPNRPRPAKAAAPGEYRMDTWTVDEGLPQNNVQCLLQTVDGYLWAGTQNGLARYDGRRFTIFDRNNTPALKSDHINCLAEGPDRTVWAGTKDGLVRWKEHQFTNFPTRLWSSSPLVDAVAPRAQGGLWVGSGATVALFDDRVLWVSTNAMVGGVQSLLDDTAGGVWIGADYGLFRMRRLGEQWEENYRVLAPSAWDGAYSLCRDDSGTVWFGNANTLWSWSEGRLRLYTQRHGLNTGLVRPAVDPTTGTLWVASHRHLHRFEAGQFTTLDTATSQPNGDLRCVLPDREGNIWFGSGKHGLGRLRPRRLVTYTAEDGLMHEDILSICEGKNGELWFAAKEGVSRLAGEQFTNFPGVMCPVFVSHSGRTWAMTEAGPSYLENGQWVSGFPEIAFGGVYSFSEDRTGKLCVASDSGVWRLGENEREFFATTGWALFPPARPGCAMHTNALPPGNPVGILEDDLGVLWVGSWGGGLHRFEHGRVRTLTTRDGLTSNLVGPLLAEPNGALWVGSDKGLNLVKDGRLTRYTTREGLAENIVGNLLEDDAGWFWTMGHRGLHRMRKQELLELAEGKRANVRTISYGALDGLLSSEANVGVFPNACQTPDGLLWFPTTRGVVVVEPHLLETRDTPPSVMLEQVIADGQVIFGDWAAAAPDHRLAPGRARLLEFQYTAGTFKAPEQVQFKVRLEGRDRQWQDVGTRRRAVYTDLAPGHYRFQVLAESPQGMESQAPAQFAFYLAPHFYQTTWFYGVSGAAVLLLGSCLHRGRVRRVLRRQALERQLALALQRERIAKDMHDDLGASLTHIGLLSDQARRRPGSPPELAADLEKIAQTTRQTAQAAQEMVWVVSPRHDTLDSLATYLCQMVGEYLEPTGIRCRFDIPAQLPNLKVPSETRQNLILFLKEALNNVAKHAAAREVWLALKVADHTVTVALLDDGQGFAIGEKPKANLAANGNGLLNLRRRARAMGGEMELHSHPGQGTCVKATIKLAP